MCACEYVCASVCVPVTLCVCACGYVCACVCVPVCVYMQAYVCVMPVSNSVVCSCVSVVPMSAPVQGKVKNVENLTYHCPTLFLEYLPLVLIS